MPERIRRSSLAGHGHKIIHTQGILVGPLFREQLVDRCLPEQRLDQRESLVDASMQGTQMTLVGHQSQGAADDVCSGSTALITSSMVSSSSGRARM